MSDDVSDGWADSASAWILEQGEDGDYGRRFVLDAPMRARIEGRGFGRALDVGCGEGRFCRIMQRAGIATTGIDPTEALLARARQMDPHGDYRQGRAETMDVDASFDLVVSYLSLIDMPDLRPAIANMVAALRPGGTLLIANLTSFNTAGQPDGWTRDGEDVLRFSIDHYMDERPIWVAWRGIRIQNWHRPLSTYMTLLLDHGLQLRLFIEPEPTGGAPEQIARHRRVPYFHIMEWQKPV
ncbi:MULTISPECIES: class I SAM-dependent methyltransferase [unclassified Bradyrhizobium]|uniref:class I SAM-dependent methyltransferase n=1 Tax=unclassified Bradyrhizobium TaxID=2631580 RepID=UPI00247A05A9|nr:MULTISPECIES: class I SAM-dependent methyltransferase [unclassified Bradyrhizobium]WGR74290.1 class I SAM-dependent methyltransferase [Bradyrhizobium sp. ISRA426]WGR79125.1 class I SAM-dependent methyltransferase [Bradyrhizobium sp. ISRA430]WGR89529.1 class I SAM-dependent methyltransferase [Bradyrhizobium sp. ISRA432]